MGTVLIFLATIVIVVGVHELGHYFAARSVGVKVLRFAIGLGKPLVSHTDKNGTQWCLCPLPLGGYVSMVNDPEMAKEHNVPPEQSLEGIERYKRAWVVVAGPLANFVLAVFLYFLLALGGETGLRAVVGRVLDDSPAQQAGFVAGDVIVAVNDHRSLLWSYVYEDLFKSISYVDAKIRVERDGGSHRELVLETKQIAPEALDKGDILLQLGLVPDRSFVTLELEEVVPGTPAEAAGLQSGDFIIAALDRVVYSWDELVEIIHDHPGKEFEIVYQRGEEQGTTQVAPERVEEDGKVFGRVGVVPKIDDEKYDSLLATQRDGPIDALATAWRRTLTGVTTTVRFFGYLIGGELSTDQLAGPVGIAKIASSAVDLGLNVFLLFLAEISISLGVINLVPIPILDGGHLLRYAIEGAIRRNLPVRMLQIANVIGAASIVALMVFAIYNDFR